MFRKLREKIRTTKYLYKLRHMPHVQYEAKQGKDYFEWFIFAKPITCHAPYLNHEAIAYRAAIGRPRVNGFFIN